MDIKIMRLGDGSLDEEYIMPEYENPNAWFASIQVGRHKISIQEKGGALQLTCSTGRFIISPAVANDIRVIPTDH